jgi:Arc/MetJ-type ribon-helix-helix transcriptional regulator
MTATRTKARITITIDREFLDLAEQAVADGRAKSVSGWIAEALEPLRKREKLADVMADILAETGGGLPTAEEEAWAREALGLSSSTQAA